MKRAVRTAAHAALLGAVLAVGCGQSAPPAAGKDHRRDHPTYRDEWRGTAHLSHPASGVLPCAVAQDPLCDHHRLTVPSPVRRLLVAIRPEQESLDAGGLAYTNDFDLYVYDARNELVAYQADEDGDESVVFETTGAGHYDVRVAPFLVTPGSSFAGMAMEMPGDMDVEVDCGSEIPDRAAIPGVTDDGSAVELGVEVWLDGTDGGRAAAVMARAAESFAPLRIELVVRRTRSMNLAATESAAILAEARQRSGGRRPADVDLVVVFTSKQLEMLGPGRVVGRADCIGGVRSAARAFAVVSDQSQIEDRTIAGVFRLDMDATAEIMSHEIGHLLGALHEMSNCVEGNLTSAGPGDVSPCTVMFNAVNGASLNFSLLEGAVVRGYAAEYASP